MNILPPAAPGHPTNLTGNVQDETSVQLSWSKPNDPNGVILGYQVFYYGYKGNHTKVNIGNKCLMFSENYWLLCDGLQKLHWNPAKQTHTPQ